LSARLSTALLLAAFVLAVPAAAVTQPQSTYPAGIARVENSTPAPGGEFSVSVALANGTSADDVAVVVCHFKTAGSGEPDLCYRQLTASPQGGAYVADTSGMTHPAWSAGTVVGFHVNVQSGSDVTCAPASSGCDQYYRVVVGAQDVTSGSDGDGGAASTAHGGSPSHASPAPLACSLAGIALAALGISRHRSPA
jgi:hypothetical protein